MTLLPADVERYQRKARSVMQAWGDLFGASPTLRAVVRAMCVAQFESRLGDAAGWTNEHNWGAIKKRTLSALERGVLSAHGISPEGGDAALAAARSLLPAAPDEGLHIDRSPGRGHHFAWFWAFPTDAAAARKFLQVLLAQRPKVRAVLEHDDIVEMAHAMYETRYYEGDSNDPETNVRAYAAHLAALEPLITQALLAPPCATCAARMEASEPHRWLGALQGSPSPTRAAFAGGPLRGAVSSGTAGMHVLIGAFLLLGTTFLARGDRT